MTDVHSGAGAPRPSAAAAAAEEGGPEDGGSVVDLSIQDLQQLGRTVERDVQSLNTNLEGLRQAHKRFADSRAALQELDEDDSGKDMLVPMTSNMFVPGKLGSTSEVLVDIGAGFFVTKNLEDAAAIFTKKIKEITAAIETISAQLTQKREQLDMINGVMSQKIAAMSSEKE